jgi:hypothetical protein
MSMKHACSCSEIGSWIARGALAHKHAFLRWNRWEYSTVSVGNLWVAEVSGMGQQRGNNGQENELQGDVGTVSLFAPAYGNLGSNIYFALGLVAAYALGLTPLAFLVTGGLFVLTVLTYTEGATMFPEAGGPEAKHLEHQRDLVAKDHDTFLPLL